MHRAVTSYADIKPAETSDVVIGLRRQFPRAIIWFGLSTFRWWAVVRCGLWRWRLIEATTTAELAEAILAAESRHERH